MSIDIYRTKKLTENVLHRSINSLKIVLKVFKIKSFIINYSVLD